MMHRGMKITKIKSNERRLKAMINTEGTKVWAHRGASGICTGRNTL